jgi:hypothetical protein
MRVNKSIIYFSNIFSLNSTACNVVPIRGMFTGHRLRTSREKTPEPAVSAPTEPQFSPVLSDQVFSERLDFSTTQHSQILSNLNSTSTEVISTQRYNALNNSLDTLDSNVSNLALLQHQSLSQDLPGVIREIIGATHPEVIEIMSNQGNQLSGIRDGISDLSEQFASFRDTTAENQAAINSSGLDVPSKESTSPLLSSKEKVFLAVGVGVVGLVL